MTSFCTRVSLVSVRFRADASLGRGRQCAGASYSLPDCGSGACQATGAALLFVSVGIRPPLLLMNQAWCRKSALGRSGRSASWELVRFVGGKRTWAGEESLQTELQANHAEQHDTEHNKAGSRDQNWRTRAHV
jgi:hypothetical protein